MTEIGHNYFMRPRKSLKAQGLFALEDSFLVHEIQIFRNMSSLIRRIRTSTILPLHVQLQKCFRHCSSFTWEIGIWHGQPVLTELWKCLEQRPQKLEGHFLASHLWFNLAHASESDSNKIIFINDASSTKVFIKLELMLKKGFFDCCCCQDDAEGSRQELSGCRR